MPDKLEVPRGSLIEWHIGLEPGIPKAHVEIYFPERSPFQWAVRAALADSAGALAGIAGEANEPGDYKYGVRAATQGGEDLGDEDPWLLVR